MASLAMLIVPRAAAHASTTNMKHELESLANVGASIRADLQRLGIETVAQLAKQDADKLYAKLEKIDGLKSDPCVWDTFAAAIHQAKTGKATAWWSWTAIRKARPDQAFFYSGSNARVLATRRRARKA
jgi:hypothetical protein